MKASPKNLLIAFLALTTVAASALALLQYRKLHELQATTSLAAAERAEWQKRVWEAEKRATEAVAQTPATPPPAAAAPAEAFSIARPDASRGTLMRGGPMPLEALMNDPDFARAMALQQRAALDGRYADLFRRLRLSPAEIDRLKDLLVERQSTPMDVMNAARAQGVGSREEIRQLLQESTAAVDAEIASLLGPERYTQYQNYEQTQSQRNLVGQLESRLSYSAAPLQDAQAEQLVQILAETSPATNAAGGLAASVVNFVSRAGAATAPVAALAPAAVSIGLGPGAVITDDTIARAQGVLAPDQLNALKEIQAEQQAQQKMAESMRNNLPRTMGRGGNAAPSDRP